MGRGERKEDEKGGKYREERERKEMSKGEGGEEVTEGRNRDKNTRKRAKKAFK